ncbi:hypothetical protein CTRI78_v000623 [Colletotrichum trifolii]|uniref:Uncharacterized protein n=1 Tax=Colletotrichum trifolii TaxID=5466 RepID=A0A4R8RUN1_COLTR|nr:hypothetical protein CTRI78_v000623 [Colletotrichum trifolii]
MYYDEKDDLLVDFNFPHSRNKLLSILCRAAIKVYRGYGSLYVKNQLYLKNRRDGGDLADAAYFFLSGLFFFKTLPRRRRRALDFDL